MILQRATTTRRTMIAGGRRSCAGREDSPSDSGGGGCGRRGSNLIKYSLCIVLLNLILVNMVEGQFFTKTSKSIPRMGRRSLPDYKSELEAYQQMLADEYEKKLINDSLDAQEIPSPVNNEGRGQGAFISDHDQKLSELLNLRAFNNRMPRASIDEFDVAPKMTRDERARAPIYGAAQQTETTREQAW